MPEGEAAREIDNDLDYISDDDDGAVLYQDSNGTKLAMANITALATVDGDTAATSLTHKKLQTAKKTPRDRVFIDDAHGVFQVRYYQEENSEGNVIPGQYGDLNCAGYRLPMHVEDVIEWQPIASLLCLVQIKSVQADNTGRKQHQMDWDNKKTIKMALQKANVTGHESSGALEEATHPTATSNNNSGASSSSDGRAAPNAGTGNRGRGKGRKRKGKS